jgi:hypothetical protein
MRLDGQVLTRMHNVLEVLTMKEMWKGEQLEVTRKFEFSLKFNQNEDEWTVGSQKSER